MTAMPSSVLLLASLLVMVLLLPPSSQIPENTAVPPLLSAELFETVFELPVTKMPFRPFELGAVGFDRILVQFLQTTMPPPTLAVTEFDFSVFEFDTINSMPLLAFLVVVLLEISVAIGAVQQDAVAWPLSVEQIVGNRGSTWLRQPGRCHR